MKLRLSVLAVAFYIATTFAQQGAVNFTAKSANVKESGTPVRINLLRWSTDAERNSLVAAMNPTAPPPPEGGARGGRGRGLDPDDPALADVVGAGAPPAGRGGRGGRGRGDAPAAPPNPIASLTAAIGKAPTLGYIWTNEVVGYAIKYAYRIPLPDGGERIILATDRRLGGASPSWKLSAAATPTDYEFTIFEIRLDSKGVGEAKTSLTTKVVVDNDAKTLAIENYAGTAAVLQSLTKK
jgi:hypothetical protein